MQKKDYTRTDRLILCGSVNGGGYECYLEMNRRVYSERGVAPTLQTYHTGCEALVMIDEDIREYEEGMGRS